MFRYLLITIFTFKTLFSYAQNENNDLTYSHLIKQDESLSIIAYNFDLGIQELLRANPHIIDPNLIYFNTKIILPLTHIAPEGTLKGIVINLAEPRLYYFSQNSNLDFQTFPIAIGVDQKTPTGKTRIAEKRKNPSWTPTQSIREENPLLPEIVLPGPNNPLGAYAITLDSSRNRKWQRIMIHGTNDPRTIGSEASHGCIRLYPKDIEMLFKNTKIGEPVTIVNQPLKIAEIENKIYLEVHLENARDQAAEESGPRQFICAHVKNCEARINWKKVAKAVKENRGFPVAILLESVNLVAP